MMRFLGSLARKFLWMGVAIRQSSHLKAGHAQSGVIARLVLDYCQQVGLTIVTTIILSPDSQHTQENFQGEAVATLVRKLLWLPHCGQL